MLSLKKIMGCHKNNVDKEKNESDYKLAQMIADIDMDFNISENGSLSREAGDNLKNEHLVNSFANASRLLTK